MYNLQGQKVFIDQYYNEDGRLESVSEPYFAITGKPSLYTYYKYDIIGRMIAQINPDGTEIETEYNGNIVKTTNNATSVYKQTQYNIIGQPKTVTDRIGSINYSYNANGQPIAIDALGNITVIDYDVAGNRMSISEPNTGTKTFIHNAFGELIEQKDQKNNTYKLFYDEFGRLTKRKEITGTFDEINYTYYQSSSQNGFGQVATITRSNGEHLRYTYDQLGRIIAKRESSPAKFFNFAYSYNKENGMLETLTYPTGFKLIYNYALNGKVIEVIRGSDKRLLWKADTENERMQLTSFHLGNGVHEFKSFDDFGMLRLNQAISMWKDIPVEIQNQQYHFETSTGNLFYRKDLLTGQNEEFDYDYLLRNRLTAAGPRQAIVDIQYQDNGNIHNKSDVTRLSGSYNYEDSRINAVSSITLPTDATADGMNEAGLVTNILWLVESEYEKWDGTKPGMSIALWAQYVLDQFATVEEAVNALQKEEFVVVTAAIPGTSRLTTVHLSISDKGGDNAIFEYVDGKLTIHHSPDYTVMTNSPIFDKQLALDEYWKEIGGTTMLPGTNRAADRFARASFYIDAIPKTDDYRVAVASVFSVIRNVSAPYGITTPGQPNISSTRWRCVSDHKNLVYYFETALTPNTFWIDLKEADFTEGNSVKKLSIVNNETYAGNALDSFVDHELFKFEGITQ